MQEVAYFNEDDEMVLTKIDSRTNGGELPKGYVRVNRGEPVGHYKVGKELTGEAFIENLEAVNKRRVEINKAAEAASKSKEAVRT